MQNLPETVAGTERSWLERLVARFESDERIAALFLGGSHAAGTADKYSDLDLTLVTTDDGWAGVEAERAEIMRSVGNPLFLEEHTDFGFLLLLFIYEDGVRGELSLAPARDLADVLGGPNIALFDPDDLLGEHVDRGLDAKTRHDLVRRMLVWFWYDRGLLDVFLARGKLWTAHFYLERCRERCLDLIWLRDRPEVWPGGHEKAEILLDPGTLDRLAPTVASLERHAIGAAARELTDFYMELGPKVAELAGAEWPARLAGSVRSRLHG